MKDEKKFASIDLLRAMAIIAIVLIHNLPNENRGMLTINQMSVLSAVHAMLNWAVPVFAMITGALLLPKDESLGKTMKRVRRIVIALFGFGFLMAFIEEFFQSHAPISAIIHSAADVLSGNTWDVMWYLYMIGGIYLILPILRAFVKNTDNKTIIYILEVLFVFNSLFPVINRLCGKSVIGFYLPCESIYMFYTIAGYFLFNRFRVKINSTVPIIGIALCIMCYILVAIKYPSYNEGVVLYEYYSPITVLMSICVFTALKDCAFNPRIVSFIAANSFGIYVIHCFYIHFINKVFNIYPEDYPMILSIPAMFAAVFVMSLISSYILRKIPVIRKYVL